VSQTLELLENSKSLSDADFVHLTSKVLNVVQKINDRTPKRPREEDNEPTNDRTRRIVDLEGTLKETYRGLETEYSALSYEATTDIFSIRQQIKAATAGLETAMGSFQTVTSLHEEVSRQLSETHEKALKDFRQSQAFERSALERKHQNKRLGALKKMQGARQLLKGLEEKADKLKTKNKDYEQKWMEYQSAAIE
jgi:hypothetical protein